jgi:O-antigen/teichoic acid export membrane protein
VASGAGRREPDAALAGDSVARNAAFALAVQVTTAAFTAALTLYLVRALDPDGYGTFTLAVAIGSLLLLPSDFGISQSAARFVAEHRGDSAAVARVLADALKLKLAGSAIVSVALLVAAGPIANVYDEPDLAWPLRGIALALFGQSLMFLFHGSFVALGRVALNLRLVLSESALEASTSVALVALGGGAAGAAFGRAIGYLFGALVGLVLAVRLLRRSGVRGATVSPGRMTGAIAGYAGALLVVDAAYTVFGQLDALLIGAFLGTTAVGLYGAPSRFLVLLTYPGLAIANGVAPRLARRSGSAPDVGLLTGAVRYLIVFQAALVPPLLVWPEPIVRLLLGPGYDESVDVLRALTPYVFLSGTAALVSLAVNYLGEARRRVPIALATVAVHLGLDLALIPTVGIVGAAIASDVAFAIWVLGHFWILRRTLAAPVAPQAVTALRSLGAAAAASGALLAAGTDPSAAGLVLGAAAGCVAFAAVLLATGEFTRSELRRAPQAFRGLLARGHS